MRKRVIRSVLVALGAMALVALVVVVTLIPPTPLTAPRTDISLPDVTVVNPGSGRRAAQQVLIRAGRIAAITNDEPARGDPAHGGDAGAAQRFAGAYVLPGLIDMHVHHPPARAVADTQLFGVMYLASGVTTVRDMGNLDDSILKTRGQILDGEFAGPRIFACGPLFDGDPPVWPGSKVVHDAEEAERAVDVVAAAGVHCIKAYQNLTPEALRGLRVAATRHHLPLVGHVPFAVPIEDAHLDDIQHLTGTGPPPSIARASGPEELIGALLDADAALDDQRIDFIVRTSIAQRLAHTPTLTVLDQLTRLDEGASLAQDPGVAVLPRYYPDVFWSAAGLSHARWRGDEIRKKVRTLVRRLHEAGVTLHVGTDTLNPFVVPGVSMHAELRNFVDCGFTPEQAWEAATRVNGAMLPESGIGTVSEGAPADLLVFRQDPTRDLAALSTLEAVVASGRLFLKPTLDATIERYRDKLHGYLYDRITMTIFRALGGAMTQPRANREPSP